MNDEKIMNDENLFNLSSFSSQFIKELIDKFIELINLTSEDEFHRIPPGSVNHIAFVSWHVMRTIDNVIFFAFDREKPIWLQNEYNQKLNLPKIDQGTNYSDEQASSLVINKSIFIDYCNDLNEAVNKKLSAADETYFCETVKVVPWGALSRLEAIGKMMISHGNEHLGEARAISTMIKNH